MAHEDQPDTETTAPKRNRRLAKLLTTAWIDENVVMTVRLPTKLEPPSTASGWRAYFDAPPPSASGDEEE
jgi:hypothetical protein